MAALEHGTFQRLRDTKRYTFKGKADVPNVYHRYRYGSFAEYPEECIRGNRRGTSNKRVCSRDIEGQPKERIRLVSNKRVILLQAAKCERFSIIAKQTRAEIRDCKLSMVNHKYGSYKLLTG